jgi:hypothetical protein
MGPPIRAAMTSCEPADFPCWKPRCDRIELRDRNPSHPILQIPEERAIVPAAAGPDPAGHIEVSPSLHHEPMAPAQRGLARICHDSEAWQVDLAAVGVTGKGQVRSGGDSREPRRIVSQHNGWLFWQEAADFSRPIASAQLSRDSLQPQLSEDRRSAAY